MWLCTEEVQGNRARRGRKQGSDATELHLDIARPMPIEGPDTGGEIAVVVRVDLVSPLLSDGVLVQLEASVPLGSGLSV